MSVVVALADDGDAGNFAEFKDFLFQSLEESISNLIDRILLKTKSLRDDPRSLPFDRVSPESRKCTRLGFQVLLKPVQRGFHEAQQPRSFHRFLMLKKIESRQLRQWLVFRIFRLANMLSFPSDSSMGITHFSGNKG
jgi:hypothetical protein